MNLNWIKTMLVLLAVSCTQSNLNSQYKGAFDLVKTYLDLDKMKEGDMILVFSKFTGCIACRNMINNDWESLAQTQNLYIITNHSLHQNFGKNIVFDSLNIINTTNLGFLGPSLLIKKENNLTFLIELTANNKDSFSKFLNFTF